MERVRKRFPSRAALALAALLLSAANSTAQDIPEAVLAKREATVLVKAATASGVRQGAGFFLAETLVVTNTSVLGMLGAQSPAPVAISVAIRPGLGKALERRGQAHVVYADLDTGLAVLRIRSDGEVSAPAQLNQFSSLAPSPAQAAYLLGLVTQASEPEGARELGVVPGRIARVPLDSQQRPKRLELEAPPSGFHGNGGPVLDAAGRLLGVLVESTSGSGAHFVIPAASLQRDLDGRPVELVLGEASRTGRTYEIPLHVPVIDPLQRMGGMRIRAWTQPRGAEPDPTGAEETSLRREPDARGFRGLIRLSLPKDHVVWLQPVVRVGEETREFPATRRAFIAAGGKLETESPPAAAGSATDAGVAAQALFRAKVELDPDGNRFDALESAVHEVELVRGAPILDVVPSPLGDEVYAVVRGRSEVLIRDPATLAPIGGVRVPRAPTSLWCTKDLLLVVCRESRLVIVVDRKTRTPTRLIRVKDERGLLPKLVLGVEADGTTYSLWDDPGQAQSHVLVHDPQGQVKTLWSDTPTSAIQSAVVIDPRRILTQSTWTLFPCGMVGLFDLPQQGPGTGTPPPGLGGDASMTWVTDTARAFLTLDQKSLVIPLRADRNQARTYVTDLALAEAAYHFPGVAIAELHSSVLVSWGEGPPPDGTPPGRFTPPRTEITLRARDSGRLLRRIRATTGLERSSYLMRGGPRARACYVPVTDRFLYWTGGIGHGSGAKIPTSLKLIPCGPLRRPVTSSVPSRLEPVPLPPGRVEAGEIVTFVPSPVGKAGGKLTYKLAAGPSEASVDPETGAFRWETSGLSIGRWEIEIRAYAGERSVPVAKWVLDVE